MNLFDININDIKIGNSSIDKIMLNNHQVWPIPVADLHYDVKDNAGIGVYDPNSTIWKDLVGNNNASILFGSGRWTDTGFLCDQSRFTYSGSFLNTSECTILTTFNPVLTGLHPRIFAENAFPTFYMLSTNNNYILRYYGQGQDKEWVPTVIPKAGVNNYGGIRLKNRQVELIYNGLPHPNKISISSNPTATSVAYLAANNTTTRFYYGKLVTHQIFNRALTDDECYLVYLSNYLKHLL
jgi:hypothetical protein